MMVPRIRIQAANDRPQRPDGAFVLYWMTAFRRSQWNYSLDRSIEWARKLNRPLVVLEAVRIGYRWASNRLHGFILNGMVDNTNRFSNSCVTYYPYVERELGQGKGLIEHLAQQACVIVTDDYPCFFLPRMLDATAARVPVLMEKVDSNGILPMHLADRVYSRAHDFRRFLQKSLPPWLHEFPAPDPLEGCSLPHIDLADLSLHPRWPRATADELASPRTVLERLSIDHTVAVTETVGGSRSAQARLSAFLQDIDDYGSKRNKPEEEGPSRLSPYLHFGHISPHQILRAILERENWSADRLGKGAQGRREGWWGLKPSSEAFLDQLITWRELGFNICWQDKNYDKFETLPAWAIETLRAHAHDPRPECYSLEGFEDARTHDALWNAAQNQLRREGSIHNYLRMLWGKKILEWSASPEEALATMIELNNKYALDGRDPNSYSGIFWVLGRYDRPWAPERPIFGRIRYMSSQNTARKYSVKNYIARYSESLF